MLRAQSLIILSTAVLLGLLAVLLASRLVAPAAPAPAEAQPVASLARIMVAAAPIQAGTAITPALVKQINWPLNALPAGAFTSPADLVDAAEPRVAVRALEANEPILASRVTGQGGRFSVSGMIAPAMRAATIRVNDVAGVGGLVLPGDRVDVLVTHAPPGTDGRSVTDVLLQNVTVLGLDQDVDAARDKPAVVKAATLEVSQLAAQKLALAQQVGSLSLALRSTRAATAAPEAVRTVSLADLRDGVAGSALPAARSRSAPAPGHTVTIVRGLQPRSYAVGRFSGEGRPHP